MSLSRLRGGRTAPREPLLRECVRAAHGDRRETPSNRTRNSRAASLNEFARNKRISAENQTNNIFRGRLSQSAALSLSRSPRAISQNRFSLARTRSETKTSECIQNRTYF